MKTILITGAAGYIGSHIADLFLQNGYEVIALDNLSRGYKQAIEILQEKGKLIFYEGDIRDSQLLEKIFTEHTVSCVVHCAALCIPDESVDQPLKYYDHNVLGTASLLEAMYKADVHRLIFSSTCAVYAPATTLPIREDYPLSPINPYGHSKLLAEEIITYYQKNNLRSVIFRYFNVCGAESEGIIGDSKKPSELLMQNAVRGALGIEPFFYTCPEVDTPDKTPIRDYIDVRDIALAHLEAYKYLEAGGQSNVFNLGSGKGSSVQEIVAAVETVLGKKIERKQGKSRRGEVAALYADVSKALTLNGWKAQHSLEDSVRSLAQWYERHPRGFD